MRWTELEAAIETEAWSEALELALQGWRERHHGALADLVDVLASRATTEPAIARGADPEAFHAAWLALAAGGRATDMASLLATVARSLPERRQRYWPTGTAAIRYATWLARLQALAKLPDDPRVARALFDFVRKAPWSGGWSASDSAVIYEPALELIGRAGDERLLAPMRALVSAPVASRQVVRGYLAEALPRAIAHIEEACRQQRPVDSEEIARSERLIEALGGRARHPRANAAAGDAPSDRTEDESALLQLVVEELEEDGPREVLSDFWLERGDARGQLITLQLKVARGPATEADQKAIRALLRDHEKTWLGELALVTKSRVFERGFLAEVELLQNAVADAKVWETAPLSPALATVRVIEKGKANEAHYRRFVLSPMARSLRELTVVSKAMLAAVCARPDAWTVEHLVLAFMPDKKSLTSIAQSSVLPRLRKITLGVTEGKIDKLLELAVPFTRARELECIAAMPLRWYQNTAPLATWLAAARTSLAHVSAIELTMRHGRSIAARAGKKALCVEMVTDYLAFAREILPALGEIEQLALRFPEGVDEPLGTQPDDAAALLGALELPVVMDDGWAKLLARAGRKIARA